jgi:hypothetical protein
MVGYIADLAFYFLPDMSGIIGLNWRLMMKSAMLSGGGYPFSYAVLWGG